MFVDQGTSDSPADSAAEEQDESAKQAPSQRDAIIYLPAIGKRRSLDDITYRMASALDLNAVTAEAKYEVGDFKTIDFRKQKTRRGTIRRTVKDNPDRDAEMDVYGFDYRGTLTNDLRQSNLLRKVAMAFVAMMIVIAKARLCRKMPGKGYLERIQIWAVVVGVSSLICGYLLLLGMAIWTAVGATIQTEKTPEGETLALAVSDLETARSAVDKANEKANEDPSLTSKLEAAKKEFVEAEVRMNDALSAAKDAAPARNESAASSRNGETWWGRFLGVISEYGARFVEVIRDYSGRLVIILATLGVFVGTWKEKLMDACHKYDHGDRLL